MTRHLMAALLIGTTLVVAAAGAEAASSRRSSTFSAPLSRPSFGTVGVVDGDPVSCPASMQLYLICKRGCKDRGLTGPDYSSCRSICEKAFCGW